MRKRADTHAGPLPVFVINLDSRPDRWRFQQLQARMHGIDIIRVAAMDGTAGRARFPQSQLTDGAKGMWHSYDTLVRRLSADGVQAAIILEDDAVYLPSLMHQARRIRDSAGPDLALVQLGFLTESSWRPNNTNLQNVRKILRPRSRLRALRSALLRDEPLAPVSMKAGMHATLVFPPRLTEILSSLTPNATVDLPLDNALVEASRDRPHQLTRVRRSLAFQLPMGSDIPWRKSQ